MPTPINQILQFGKGSGANVLTPAAYAALTALLNNGFQAGEAYSIQFNTVLRQSSFIATMIAQFICDNANVDVNDDGDLSTLETKFVAALNALITPEIDALATAFDAALTNEATLRANADTTEANTRWTNDNALQANINTEATTRATNDNALSAKIGAVGGIDLQTQIYNQIHEIAGISTSFKANSGAVTVMHQYGFLSSATDGSYMSFPYVFPNECDMVIPILYLVGGTYSAPPGAIALYVKDVDQYGFHIGLHDNNGNPVTCAIMFIAIGQ